MHAPYYILYLGAWAELTWRDLDLLCGRAVQLILTVTYTMNMIIALTACRDREAKVWRPKSMVYFSPCSIARRYTKGAQIFNITNQANAPSDERTQWDRS